MNLTRHIKGKTLGLVDRFLPVKPIERPAEEQTLLNRESRRMHLYYSRQCPSSISVKRYLERAGLHPVTKEVERADAYRNELVKGGGESRVPCLRICTRSGDRWIYSPEAIINYLEKRLGKLGTCKSPKAPL